MKTLGRKKISWLITGIVILSLLMMRYGCGKKKEQKDAANAGSIPVAVKTAQKTTFTSSLRLQGTVVSLNFALVPAKTGGTIEELLVNEGEEVVKGQPLCKLDSENLSRAAETLHQEVAVASSALKVSRAMEEQANTSLSQAKRDYDRFRKLEKEDAVSVHRLEEAETRWKNSTAAHQVALAQVGLSKARLKQAEVAHAIAERNLKDATVTAPINGVISARYYEKGEMVDSGNSVFRIDDPSSFEISAFAPANNYNNIIPTQSIMRVYVNGMDIGETPVVYRSPVIEETLRTFEIKALFAKPPAGVVAGAIADIDIILQRRDGRGVPASAVLQRGGKKIIFVVKTNKAHQLTVTTGFYTDGLVEIVDGLPDASASVIVQGQDLVNDGDTVTVVEGK